MKKSWIAWSVLATGVFLAILTDSPVLAQVGVVRGTVVDDQGNPIPGVEVRIEGMDVTRKYKTKTNKEGKYIHAGVSLQGIYRVIVEKDGYQPDYVQGLKPAFSTTDEERGVADFTLRKGEKRPMAFEMTDEDRAKLQKQQEEQKKKSEQMAAIREQFNQGVEFYNSAQYEEARAAFLSAAEKDPDQPAVWANLANTYVRLKENEKAVEAYDKAIELSPDDPSFYQNRGSIYVALGDAEKAQADYEHAASLAGDNDPAAAARNFYNLGVTFINTGRNKEAAEALNKAIELDPSHAESRYQLGITLIGLNQLEEAITQLKKFVELAPSSPDAEVAKALIEQLGGGN